MKRLLPQSFVYNVLQNRSLLYNGIRSVSTSSSLVTTFNTKPTPKLNLNFSKNVGLFGLEALQTYDGFYLMKEDAKIRADELIEEACSPNRNRKIVDIFDELSDTLCRVADLAEFVRVGHPDSKFACAAEDACITISGLVEKLNTHKPMYEVLNRVCKGNDLVEQSDIEEHVANLFLFDFEQCGIHLDEERRKQVVSLNNYILHMGQKFMAGSSLSRSMPKYSLPPHLRSHFADDNNNLVVSNQYIDSESEGVREAVYRVYLSHDCDQQHYLDDMLAARHQLAILCGFPTYSHRALKSSLAGSPKMVDTFLSELNTLLKPFVEDEFKLLLEVKKKHNPEAKEVYPWDLPYLSSKLKRVWSQATAQDFMPYFSLGSCMDGLNLLFQDLYGIRLESAKIEHGEVWCSDVYKLAVVHEKEGLLGYIYCDFYERTGKPNQDCHFTIRCGRQLPDGSYQNPIVVVMLNLPSPGWSAPCLLTPSMLENLFHEMGHAMHSMLGRTRHQHVSGTRTPTDFAEVPSILMEYFTLHPKTVSRLGRHYATGEEMPSSLVAKLVSSRRLLPASEMCLQIFYSALDQRLHGSRPLPGSNSTIDTLREVQEKFYPLNYVNDTHWELRFSHLVGYGAKYYSYLMSKSVASWIWQGIFNSNPTNRTAGESYRREVLSHGGSKPPAQLLYDFLHKEVNPSTLAQSIVSEIESQKMMYH